MAGSSDQIVRAEEFRRLHHESPVLVLANAWDVVSARIVASLPGCTAIATSSAAVAWALGYPDGERIPPALMFEAVARIAAAVPLAVTADVEAGYGDARGTAAAVAAAGAVGANLEDGAGDVDAAAGRVREARAAVPWLVVNARVDVLLRGTGTVDEAIERANTYLEAGADCAFVPGVSDAETIHLLAERINGPLNLLAEPGTPPIEELERLGVARVSLGSGLASVAYARAAAVAGEALQDGRFEALADRIPFAELNELFACRPREADGTGARRSARGARGAGRPSPSPPSPPSPRP